MGPKMMGERPAAVPKLIRFKMRKVMPDLEKRVQRSLDREFGKSKGLSSGKNYNPFYGMRTDA